MRTSEVVSDAVVEVGRMELMVDDKWRAVTAPINQAPNSNAISLLSKHTAAVESHRIFFSLPTLLRSSFGHFIFVG